ncbi:MULTISPECIES: hypothetical protein [unclassified Nocardioides]|uniref:hypothetical protein n=1 Tax=unclassified Nocardioides TaxID=2615069 RepID=UPI0009EF9E52|nr:MULTISPECIES: hypothetical protein [unclassified Nocardioides]GAW50903.1 Carbamate kinase [Nocardioides sp. PD653-B2]GAW54061.1 Carbamate kinase [Nocardioides sp. PD653]
MSHSLSSTEASRLRSHPADGVRHPPGKKVPAVGDRCRPVPRSRELAEELDATTFPAGSMGPKVEAARRFVSDTGRRAAIGALADAGAVIAGLAGTQVTR